MEIWLDTTRLETIDYAKSLGILHGVTTNPKLIAEAKVPLSESIGNLLSRQDGPVAIQLIEDDVSKMVRQAEKWNVQSMRIIIKVPVTYNGLLVMHRLARQGIPVMATAVFEPYQAMMAIRAGASYVALYYGRANDQGLDAAQTLRMIMDMKANYKFDARILVASVRTPQQVNSIVQIGADAITMGDSLFREVTGVHPGTAQALAEFSQAALC